MRLLLHCALIIGGAAVVLLACTDQPGSALVAEAATRRLDDRARWTGEIASAIDTRLALSDAGLGASPQEKDELSGVYGPSVSAPLWLDSADAVNAPARDALSILEDARAEGLDPGDYGGDALPAFADALVRNSDRSIEDLARFDVALSLGMLRYLRHVHTGRVDPRAIGFRMTVPPDDHDFSASLRAAVLDNRIPDAVASFTPPLVLYCNLRALLPRYRALATRDLAPLPPFTVTVHPGESYGGLPSLRARLVAFGDLAPDAAAAESTTYEGAIVDAVKRFQGRHGLDPDGVIGKSTVAAVAVPVSWRARQIELALERLRWLPHLGDRRFLALNIPMFRLWGWDSIPADGAPSFSMGVVVGRALNTQTPVFVEEMQYLIVRPYWNVPRSILRHEILPAVARDRRYLDRHDMEIVSGDGDAARPVALTEESLAALRTGRLRVRQRPGPRNALGLIKFMFPNDDNVYMHDTPAQELFSRARRDFSHGCVRLADPIALAEWALNDQPEWTRERIIAAMNGTTTRRVNLGQPIQVILYYITAVVMPEDGTIHFADDIYGHDTRLDRALHGVLATR